MLEALNVIKNIELMYERDGYGKQLDIFDEICNKNNSGDFILALRDDYTDEQKIEKLRSLGIGMDLGKLPKARHQELFDLDILAMHTRDWRRTKQLYIFDAEMESSFLKLPDVRLEPGCFDRLPFKTLYIQFKEDGEIYKEFDGAFVKVINQGNGYYVSAVFISNPVTSEGGYYCVTYTSTGILQEKKEITFKLNDMISNSVNKEKNIKDIKNAKYAAMGRFFILNALLYLNAVNADIKESEISKTTYKAPTSRIKDKFSEVRQWEVGVRYGEAVRLHKKNFEKNKSQSERKAPTNRKQPKPHAVRGHFQKYHVGKGRKQLEIKWIDNYFCGMTEGYVNDVIIHKADA